MQENLKIHTKVLSSDIGERNFSKYQNLEKAGEYIFKEFKSYGYPVKEQTYYLEGKPFKNIIAIKEGKRFPKRIIVVGAHYDSVIGSKGADDNASGVAGLLELARALSKVDLNKTVEFVAFVNEEPPLFMTEDMGSLRYVKEAKEGSREIVGMLCLESIGYYSDEKNSQQYPFGFGLFYPDRGNFIAFVSNLNSKPLLDRVVKEFRKNSKLHSEYLVAPIILTPAISFSDNYSFWRYGYKAIMVTDTAFYRNPYYHTYSDTFERLDYESILKLVKGLYGVLLKLCE